MSQKSKSRFMIPMPGLMPGRKTKDGHAATRFAPMSKAQRILGTTEINVDYNGSAKDYETREIYSSSGISISASVTSMDLRDGMYGAEELDLAPQLGLNERAWDEESEICPKYLHSGGGPRLRSTRSAATLGVDYYADGSTDVSSLRRLPSNSTMGAHYDKSHVPLSVSQQTSNSAIALGGLPGQPCAESTSHRRKRPSKLDLLLGRASRQNSTAGAKSASPHFGGGDHVIFKSPSLISFKSSRVASNAGLGEQRNPNKLVRRSQQPKLDTFTPTVHHLPMRDTTGLHQLYDHYEEMSFRNAPSPTEEEAPESLTPDTHSTISPPQTARTSVSFSASQPLTREPCSSSDKSSISTRNLKSSPGTLEAMVSTTGSMGDCAASISSRQTRTSKASRTDRNPQSLDRQQNSVLSLSDSDTDEDIRRPRGRSRKMATKIEAPLVHPSQLDTERHMANQEADEKANGAPATTLKAFLDIPRTSSRTAASRPRTNSLLLPQQSLVANSAHPALAASSSSSNLSQISGPSLASGDESTGQVHEAQTVTIRPLASTAEAALEALSQDTPLSEFEEMLTKRSSQGTPRGSPSSQQPTPPLSPNSAELDFYYRSPAKPRRSSVASNASEKGNGRVMAVTRQEEMLLAAMREKRAKMRANSASSGSGAEKVPGKKYTKSTPRKSSVISQQISSVLAGDSTEPSPAASTQTPSKKLAKDHPRTHVTELRKATSRRPMTSDGYPLSKQARSKQECVLLYLDQPIRSGSPVDFGEPSPDLSDFDEEWAAGNRQSRIKSKMLTEFANPGFGPKKDNGRPRADSDAVSPRGEGPGDDSEFDDDGYLDDFDFDDFPEPGGKVVVSTEAMPAPMPGPTMPLPPIASTRSRGAEKHIKAKRSLARLSAVGGPPAAPSSTPPSGPWWGDDD